MSFVQRKGCFKCGNCTWDRSLSLSLRTNADFPTLPLVNLFDFWSCKCQQWDITPKLARLQNDCATIAVNQGMNLRTAPLHAPSTVSSATPVEESVMYSLTVRV
ncbi:hypothetical protein FRC20_008198 [Serendipita sp. 405]|nr:hypothetical protein FRC20_008198 [Serendipita sp. 405]